MYKKYNKELTVILLMILLLVFSPLIAEAIWPASEKYFRLLFFLVAASVWLAPVFTVQIQRFMSNSKNKLFNEIASKDELFVEQSKSRKYAGLFTFIAMVFVSIVLFLNEY